MRDRHLEWDGCFNIRDLGGIPARGGRTTRAGAVVRADSLDRLTPDGWAALRAHGIRTVVDLRNGFERDSGDAAARRHGVTTVHVPLDDTADTAFWTYVWKNGLDGSPLYFRPFLERKAERCAAAVSAIARAEPGGVAVHCVAGRDRTGLVTLLLLALAGVEPDHIADDYELSARRLPALFAALGMADQGPEIESQLARRSTTARDEIRTLLTSFDIEDHLRAGGADEGDLTAVRDRLLNVP